MLHIMPNYFTPTINDVVAKGQHFLCEFVELKRNGYHHYTRALNDLTVGFWRPWLDESDKAVDQLADNMKLAIKFK